MTGGSDTGHDWHSHVYFDADSVTAAEALIAEMKIEFGLTQPSNMDAGIIVQ